MVYTPRVVGSDRPGVQPIQPQQVQPLQDKSSDLLKGAAQANVYSYNMMQQGVQNLADLTNKTTENAIARNDMATKVAVTAAQYAGQSQAKLAQELGNISEVMQRWDASNTQKKQYKEQMARQLEKDKVEAERYEYDKWMNELKYSEGLQLQVYDRQTEEKAKIREQVIKETLAKQEQHYNEQEAAAFVEIQDVMTTLQQDAYTNNPLYVRNKLLEVVGKYDVRPEKIPSLLAPGYTMLQGVDKEQFTKRQEYADKVQTQLLAQQKFKLANKMSGALARLKNDYSGDVQPLLDEIATQVKDFVKENPSMGVLEAITLQNYALEEANKSVTISAENREKIRQQLNDNNAFINALGIELEDLNAGGQGIQQYQAKLRALAITHNIPIEEAKDLGNPLQAREFMLEQQELSSKLRKLQEEGQLQDLPQVNLSDMQVGTLAWYFHKHPDQYNAIKNGAGNFKQDPIFLRAEGVMTSYKAFAEKKNAAQAEYRRIELAQRAFGEDTLKASRGVQNPQSGDFKSQIEQKIQVYFGGVDTSTLNPEAYATWEAFRKAGNDLFDKQKAGVQNSYAEEYKIMQQYGLHEGEKSAQFTQAKYDAIRKQIDTVHQNYQPQQQQVGTQPNFNQGAPSKISTQFAKAVYRGTPIATPFRAGTVIQIGDGHGAAGSPHHGRNRPHGGLDIAVKEGTPLIATGNGVVVTSKWQNPGNKKEGYGYFVDIKLDDGSIQRFGHLQGSFVKPGQRVSAGQVFGKAGNTGRSTGSHLHWEFRRSAGGGFENTLDPISNANRMISTIGTIRPRDDNTSWQSGYNPYGGSHPDNLGAVIPKNAVPLWGGTYILNGKIYEATKARDSGGVDTSQFPPNPNGKPVEQSYNRRNPVKGTALQRDKIGYKPANDNNPNHNFHYAVLARDNEFRKALHTTAKNLGIPSVWLADIIAFETGGTFRPDIDNGVGYVGLAQFGDLTAKDMNTTRGELAKMTRAQQMKYVEWHIKNQMRYAGIKSIDNIETALALVFGGHGLAKKFADNPKSAGDVSDINTSFKGYLNQLGRHGGRRYNHFFTSRRENAAKIAHTKYVDGCPMCNQMIASNTNITPHDGQA